MINVTHAYIVTGNEENTRGKNIFSERTNETMRIGYMARTSASLLACAALLAACGGHPQANQQAQQTEDVRQIRVEQTAPQTDEERKQATAARLESLAESIPEVEHANCVIVGKTAIVGIDVRGDLDRSRVGTIKYAVAETLRKDPVGVNAFVTADLDLYHRLQEIKEDMANGRPIQGILEELSDIVGRIIPQLPDDTVDIDSPPHDPNAATQEQGVQKSQSSQGGEMPKQKQKDEPNSNRDFQSHPKNR